VRRAGIATAAVAAFLVSGAAAHAAAVPTSPPNGANVGPNIHPTFAWALPPGERSSFLRVARKPTVTPEGRFPLENVEQGASLTDTQTQYTAVQALPAGRHWWTVDTYRTSPYATYVSAPVGFSIAPRIGKPRVKITRYRYTRRLGVDVRITGNTPSALVKIKAYRGHRLVGKKSERVKRYLITSRTLSFVVVQIRNRRAHKLKVVVSVSYGKTKAVRRKTVRGV
jgi:hypothetical protein